MCRRPGLTSNLFNAEIRTFAADGKLQMRFFLHQVAAKGFTLALLRSHVEIRPFAASPCRDACVCNVANGHIVAGRRCKGGYLSTRFRACRDTPVRSGSLQEDRHLQRFPTECLLMKRFLAERPLYAGHVHAGSGRLYVSTPDLLRPFGGTTLSIAL